MRILIFIRMIALSLMIITLNFFFFYFTDRIILMLVPIYFAPRDATLF